MYHGLRFRSDCQLGLQVPGKGKLERVMMRKGTVIEAQVRPHVEETEKGPVECADLDLKGDGILLSVRMKCFSFE